MRRWHWAWQQKECVCDKRRVRSERRASADLVNTAWACSDCTIFDRWHTWLGTVLRKQNALWEWWLCCSNVLIKRRLECCFITSRQDTLTNIIAKIYMYFHSFRHNILLPHNLHTQTLHIVWKSGCISELEAKAFHTFAMPLTICAQILRFVIRAVPESGFSVIIQNSKWCTFNFYILPCGCSCIALWKMMQLKRKWSDLTGVFLVTKEWKNPP